MVDLQRLPKVCQGLDLVGAYLLPHSGRWIKAVDWARRIGVDRRTVSRWCRTRPSYGRRVGRTWFVRLDHLGLDDEQREILNASLGPVPRRPRARRPLA